MLSQPKIDLAVLLKLHAHFDTGGEAVSAIEIESLFNSDVFLPPRRIEMALEELERRGEVTRAHDRYALDETVWKISRAGTATVDRALLVPASFIARLNLNGDSWLDSDDAHNAVLQKSSKRPEPADLPMSTVVPPVLAPAQTRQINWTKWGTVIGAVGVLATILVAVLS